MSQVAQTIYQQLGGHKFKVMTGAKSFIADANSLQVRRPNRFAANGINLVKITLNGSDLYDVQFKNLTYKLNTKYSKEYNNVYFDQLVSLFESETKLATKLF